MSEATGGRADSPLRAYLRAAIAPSPGADPVTEALLAVIRQRHGDSIQAVLAYGSWLRGKRDTVLDFYVLLDDYRSLPGWQRALAWLLAPNVYHIGAELPREGRSHVVRAKYAVLTPARWRRGNARAFHSYFWARFAQPSRTLYCRDADAEATLLDGLEAAPGRFAGRVLAMLPARFDSRALWQGGLSLTYRCELRSERPGQAEALYQANRGHFDTLTRLLADGRLGFAARDEDDFQQPPPTALQRRAAAVQWWLRAGWGKLLSLARVTKGALTFEAPLEYLLWKIERHSGLRVQPTPRQLRHPLLFAWPLLWRLYRQGAFR